MIELTEQEKCVILGIAKRTPIDVDGDVLSIYVHENAGYVTLLETPMIRISEEELKYIHHDVKITNDLLKDKSWFDSIKGIAKKIGRSNGRHDVFHF